MARCLELIRMMSLFQTILKLVVLRPWRSTAVVAVAIMALVIVRYESRREAGVRLRSLWPLPRSRGDGIRHLVGKRFFQNWVRFAYSMEYGEFFQATDSDLAGLREFPEIKRLKVMSSNVGDQAAQSLSDLRHLSSLEIERCSFSDEDLSRLAAAPALVELKMAESDIGGTGFGTWVNSPLETLELEACSLTLDGLQAIGSLPALRKLKITHRGLFFASDNINPTNNWRSLDKLREMDLEGEVSEFVIANLHLFKNLRVLRIGPSSTFNCNIFTQIDPTDFSLEELSVPGTWLTDGQCSAEFVSFVQKLPNLKLLNDTPVERSP